MGVAINAMGKKYDKKPNGKNATGRPEGMTQTVLDKLEQAFSWGCTDVEACLWAGISDDLLYKYQRENPEFIKRKAQLKETPTLKARQVMNIALGQKDKQAAQWWLERKRKEEFSTRSELVQPEPIKVFITKEEEAEADAVIDNVVKPRDDK